MYEQKIYKKDGLEGIQLFDSEGYSKATIILDQGGRLELLTLDGVNVIESMKPLTYENTYASSILFPFANRVKNGSYEFSDEKYQLDCNEKGKENALHGLVYNKRFEVESYELALDFGLVTLYYESDGSSKGFPFKYILLLTYKITKSAITLMVNIKNTDSNSFPYTLGWHPCFISSDIYNSSLYFKSNKKLQFDSKQIPSSTIDCAEDVSFQIKDNPLDDGYVLAENKIEFITPKYKMLLQSTSQENFLQLYTPPKLNTIAIEPMTGIADSFNNKVGLQILNPNKAYQVSWNINIKNTNK